jgi:DNA-directed RNA polymerase subunit L
MELNVIEKSKNKIIIEVRNENHTLCNALKDELYNDDAVKSAGYFIKHPVLGIPTMVVETKQGTDVVDAIVEAGKRLKKTNAKFLKEFEKEIK